MTVKEVPEDGKCYKCNAPLGPDAFCYGCGAFICDSAGDDESCEPANWSVASAMGHGHDPEDHWEEYVDDDDDDAAEWI